MFLFLNVFNLFLFQFFTIYLFDYYWPLSLLRQCKWKGGRKWSVVLTSYPHSATWHVHQRCPSASCNAHRRLEPKVTSPPLHSLVPATVRRRKMDGFDSLSASEKAEATELQRMIAIEQQKAQFQAQVRQLTVLTVLIRTCSSPCPAQARDTRAEKDRSATALS